MKVAVNWDEQAVEFIALVNGLLVKTWDIPEEESVGSCAHVYFLIYSAISCSERSPMKGLPASQESQAWATSLTKSFHKLLRSKPKSKSKVSFLFILQTEGHIKFREHNTVTIHFNIFRIYIIIPIESK